MKFSILLQYITPHRRVLLAVLGLLLAGSVLSLAQPWLAGKLTGVLLGTAQHANWNMQEVLLLWLCLIIARSVLGFFTQYSIRLVLQTSNHLSCSLQKIQYLSRQSPPV